MTEASATTPGLPLGEKLRYGAEAAIFFAFMALFRVLGLDKASRLGGWIGRNIFPLLPPDRVARANLAAAFPEKSEDERNEIRGIMWDNLGRVVGEYPHLGRFSPKGEDPPPFIGQDASGTKISGVNDAAGKPFWFNGQTRITLTDEGALSQGGSKYNGNRLASSGAPLQAGPPRPYTLRFTRKGTFSYYCTIHPGMKGTVKVVSRGKRIPTNRANARAAKKEYARVVKRLKKDTKFPGRLGNAVEAGHDTLTTTFFRFFPATKSVPVGTSVTFLMSPKTTEAHTISFGPADYLQKQADAFITPDPINPQLPPVVSPVAAFPSEPPPQAPLDPAQHGNGFFNTGVLDRDGATPLNPPEARVTFNKPGTYNFICLIHPDMKGSIVVG